MAMETVDAVVVGAGPAGALAARELARGGFAVRLVDRARFPRNKVCGSCLGARGMGILEDLGLGGIARELGSPLRSLRCSARGRRVAVRLAGGAVIERAELDQALARAAVEAGARFQDGVRARLGPARPGAPWRRVLLESEGRSRELRARLVLDARGLSFGLDSGAERGSAAGVAPGARIGLGWLLPAAASELEAGTIEMAVGRAGYAGLVRLADGRLDLAAALDPKALRRLGAVQAVEGVRAEAGLAPLRELDATRLQGTPPLTRRPPRVAGGRRLAVGDAAGYVEPFTGEGIGWALEGARRVAELVAALGLEDGAVLERAWERCHRRTIARRQRTCALLARLLRRPRLAGGLLGLAQLAPRLSSAALARIARGLHAPAAPSSAARAGAPSAAARGSGA